MEGFFQHVRSLRMQISDYEDKASEINARKQQEQTAIRSLQQDLVRAAKDVTDCVQTTERLINQCGSVGRSILAVQQQQQQADLDLSSLEQAINLMKEGLNASVIKQSSKERELDSAYEAMSAQLDEYKNFYLTRELAALIRKIDQEFEDLRGKIPETNEGNSASKEDSEELQAKLMQIRSQYARAEEEKAAVAEEVQKSDDTIQAVKAQIGEVTAEIEKLSGQINVFPEHVRAFAGDDETAALREELEGVAEDKTQEKEYAADCRQRLEVLQADQVLDCPSCGQQYEVKASQFVSDCARHVSKEGQSVTPMEV